MTRVKELTFSKEIKQTCDAIKCYLLTALKILNFSDIKASRQNLFQNNSAIEFNYTLMDIRMANLRKPEKIELNNNKHHFRVSRQQVVGPMCPRAAN
jgi:hypothetical protein